MAEHTSVLVVWLLLPRSRSVPWGGGSDIGPTCSYFQRGAPKVRVIAEVTQAHVGAGHQEIIP
jgi:hypothetical protein